MNYEYFAAHVCGQDSCRDYDYDCYHHHACYDVVYDDDDDD